MYTVHGLKCHLFQQHRCLSRDFDQVGLPGVMFTFFSIFSCHLSCCAYPLTYLCRLGQPLALAEKIVYSHLDDPHNQVSLSQLFTAMVLYNINWQRSAIHVLEYGLAVGALS